MLHLFYRYPCGERRFLKIDVVCLVYMPIDLSHTADIIRQRPLYNNPPMQTIMCLSRKIYEQ